jgi:hypothetical protein
LCSMAYGIRRGSCEISASGGGARLDRVPITMLDGPAGRQAFFIELCAAATAAESFRAF